ncbi:MAG: hypothetical protein AN485_24100, partial [Anabaena sp. MDT14b]
MLLGLICVSVSLGITAAPADDFTDAGNLYQQGKLEQAMAKTNAGLAVQPKDAQGRFLKGLILTEQGELLWRAARDMTQRLEKTKAQLTETREHPSGELKVTTTVGLGRRWLAPRLGDFL